MWAKGQGNLVHKDSVYSLSGVKPCPSGASTGSACQLHVSDVGPHRPLDELNAGLQVQPEVDEVPLDALALVLLLLQDEHGVVEELLQLLVGVVDTQLLE